MGLVNCLFPAFIILNDAHDFDISPYSASLRDSIRFTVYEYIVGDDSYSDQKRHMIRMRLLCSCDISGYLQA